MKIHLSFMLYNFSQINSNKFSTKFCSAWILLLTQQRIKKSKDKMMKNLPNNWEISTRRGLSCLHRKDKLESHDDV